MDGIDHHFINVQKFLSILVNILSGSCAQDKLCALRCQRIDSMDSVNSTKNIEPATKGLGSKYNLQHLVFVTKYKYKMFRNPKTIAIIKSAFYDTAGRHKLTIKELSFGEDYAHVHMEVSVPINMSVSKAAQLLKGYSSYMVFKEIPNHRLRYPQGHFWEKTSVAEVLDLEVKKLYEIISEDKIYLVSRRNLPHEWRPIPPTLVGEEVIISAPIWIRALSLRL